MTPWQLDTMRPHDRDYVFDSWKRSYRESPRAVDWPSDVYDAFQQRVIERLLPHCTVLVARPEGWAEGIMAWVCVQQKPDAFLLHYAFAKRRFRKRVTGESVFWQLIDSLKPHGEMLFTHLRPPYTNTLTTHGFAFAPERASTRGDAA